MGLEELAPEARAHKTSLRAAWVDAAEALRSAIHAHEAERGPLAEALFPVWRAPALRRHADQALAAETELRRRLASAYVVRRLAEPTTRAALRSPLEALEAAGAAWDAERDRAALGGAEADEVGGGLLAAAEETGRTLDRVRLVVRAALVAHPELLEVVFPRRSRAAIPAPLSENSVEAPPEIADVARAGVEASPNASDRVRAAEPTARGSVGEQPARRRKKDERSAEPTATPRLSVRAQSRPEVTTPSAELPGNLDGRSTKATAKPARSTRPRARSGARPPEVSVVQPAPRRKASGRSAAPAPRPRLRRGGARS